MYGKSYDGITGLMAAGGTDSRPGRCRRRAGTGVRLVPLPVRQRRPAHDPHRYAALPGLHLGEPAELRQPRQFQDYATRSAANLINPACVPATLTAQQSPLPNDPYWRGRGVMEPLKRSRVPIFLTQGFIDQNTAADGLTELLRATKGPVTGWLGCGTTSVAMTPTAPR